MMKFLASAVLALTMSLPMAAQAATCTLGDCGLAFSDDADTLSDGVGIALVRIGATDGVGDFKFEGSFLNDTDGNGGGVATILQFAPSDLGNILNLTFDIVAPASIATPIQSFAITNALGEAIGGGLQVDFVIDLLAAPGETIDYIIHGTSVAGLQGALPTLGVSIAPVPLPAAGGMLLTAVVAGGIAARRKKKAA